MWGDEAALAAARQQVDEWESALRRRAQRATGLSGRIAGLSATARSDDGLVDVTLDASGELTGLHLSERTRNQPAARTAEQILATVRTARTELLAQLTATVTDALGADDPATRAIVDSYTARLRPTDADERAPSTGAEGTRAGR